MAMDCRRCKYDKDAMNSGGTQIRHQHFSYSSAKGFWLLRNKRTSTFGDTTSGSTLNGPVVLSDNKVQDLAHLAPAFSDKYTVPSLKVPESITKWCKSDQC